MNIRFKLFEVLDKGFVPENTIRADGYIAAIFVEDKAYTLTKSEGLKRFPGSFDYLEKLEALKKLCECGCDVGLGDDTKLVLDRSSVSVNISDPKREIKGYILVNIRSDAEMFLRCTFCS